MYITVKNLGFSNTFIQQICIKLKKSDIKDIYNVTKFSYIFILKSWKCYSMFLSNYPDNWIIKQHSCFQLW